MVKKVLIVAVVLALAGAGYWFLWPKADSVAVVNGQHIARSELKARVDDIILHYAMWGIDVTAELAADIEEGVLDEMIAETLLFQAAQAAGIEISAQEVDDYYDLLVTNYESEQAFLDLLAEAEYTIDTIKEQIAEHLAVLQFEERYIQANVPPELLIITEAEIHELYDYYASDSADELPPLAEVSHYLEQELRQERIAELDVLYNLVEELRAEAVIEITL